MSRQDPYRGPPHRGDPYSEPRYDDYGRDGDYAGGRGGDWRGDRGGGGGGGGGGGRGGYGGGYGGGRRDDWREEERWRDSPPARPQHWDEREDRDDRKRGRYDDYDARPPPRDYQPPPPRQYEEPYHPPQEDYRQPSYPSEQPSYQDDQRTHQQDRGEGGRDRRPAKPDTPSASVVLLGLPPTVDDLQLNNFLTDMGASVDSTTVIVDRATGVSKRYGFAKFASVEHARAFVEPNWPVVTWRERGMNGLGKDDGMKIKINYSQKSGGYREDQGATSRTNDDQRKAAEATQPPQSIYHNDGTRDIGSAPTQILLLRGLDPLTSETDIVAGLSTIQGRAGEEIRQGKGVKKILITKDRQSRSSWGYAFVQFADVRLATEVLANAFNPHVYPTGFRIRNSVIAVSFCHENSFIPIYAKSEWSFKGEGGQELAYWDDKAFVTAWLPEGVKSKEVTKSAAPKASAIDSSEADMEAFFSSLEAEVPPALLEAVAASAPPQAAPPVASTSVAPGALPVSTSATPTISIQLKSKTTPGAFSALPSFGPGSAPPAAASPASTAEKKKNVELIQSRKASANISKWNVKQQELKAPDPAEDAPVPSLASTVPSSATASVVPAPSHVASPAPSKASSAAVVGDNLEFGDTVAMICLLCQRQFKGIDDLKKHNKLSALHKNNLANETIVAEARARKAKKDAQNAAAASAPEPENATAESKYIDRAAVRREAFNQPDHPKHDSKKRRDGPPPPPPPEVQPNRDGIEESNVGAKMLEKMGWAKGGGLGSRGAGIVDPIQASQFQQGAGLGATRGVAVGSYDPSPQGLAERARMAARARYDSA